LKNTPGIINGIVTATENANNYKSTSIYYIRSHIQNTPTDCDYCFLLILKAIASYDLVQYIFPRGNLNLYKRTGVSNSENWGVWYKIAFTAI
jgi:hypothetical protein